MSVKSTASRFGLLLAAVGLGAVLVPQIPAVIGGEGPSVAGSHLSDEGKAQVEADYGKLPMYFEANVGQSDPAVKFVSRGRGYRLFLTPTEAVLSLQGPPAEASDELDLSLGAPSDVETPSARAASTSVLRMQLRGGNPEAEVSGGHPLAGRVNYLVGADPDGWHTDIPTYGEVAYRGVYPGIDAVYYGKQDQLEYDFIVAPGADPSVITLGFEGAEGLTIDEGGDLVLATPGGEVRQHAPVIYQELDGERQPVSGTFVRKGPSEVGFELSAYDRTRPLVIDPVLDYSTHLGGSGSDNAQDIAVDAAGHAYVLGGTTSSDFPTAGSAQPANGVFIAKMNPAGSGLVYTTFLGRGSGAEIAIDDSGAAYITGSTSEPDFPTTAGAFDDTCGTDGACNPREFFGRLILRSDAYLAKLDPSGSTLLYSTYLGGSGDDGARGIALHDGVAYISGSTSSTDFPITGGALQQAPDSGFLAKVDPSTSGPSSLVYSTYLAESGADLAVDPAGAAYVVGSTQGSNFPTTPGAFDTSFNGFRDGFVTKVSPDGSALVYSTYLGGSRDEVKGINGSDLAAAVAVDSAGHAYVTGITGSSDFPTTANAFQAQLLDPAPFIINAFMTKLAPDGASLAYSTQLGRDAPDQGTGIAVDDAGNAYVTGNTRSHDFPVVDPIQRKICCENFHTFDVFVAKFDTNASHRRSLVFSTFLGGTNYDEPRGIALDGGGNAYVAGFTNSPGSPPPDVEPQNFPTTAGALQPNPAGSTEAFVLKISGI
jgi:hypothetical protein